MNCNGEMVSEYNPPTTFSSNYTRGTTFKCNKTVDNTTTATKLWQL